MFNRTQLSIAVSAALTIALVGTVTDAMAQTTQQLDRVEVTGSSIKRIGAETALPVQTITREEIQRSGASNVEQLMQTISANLSVGSITSSSSSGSTTLGISSISLRGLTSQRTLVLINGRRITPYGYGFTNDSVSVDVNSIPLAAIDRVEILKDGASAIYGSDAIAGVVNFILRRDYQGAEATAEYGAARQGSGSIARASATFGLGDLAKDRFNAFAVVSYQKEKALFGRDRDFAASGINVDNFNDTSSGNTFPANFVPVDGSFGSRNPSFPACPGPYAIRSPLFDQIGSQGCRFDPSPILALFPEAERYGIFTSGRFDLTPNVQLFAEASFYRNEQNTRIQPTPISDQFTIPLNNPLAGQYPYSSFVGGAPLPPGEVSGIPYSTIVLTSASPFYPTAFVQQQTGGATPDLLIRWRSSALGDRDTTDTSEATRLVLGARGTFLSNWDYDTALLYSRSEVKQTVNDGFVRLTQVMPLLNSGQINFFGPQTPAAQAALNATKFFGDALKTETSLLSLSGTMSTQLGRLPGGPLGLALGAEGRREAYKLDPALVLQQGDLTGYGGNFFPVDRDRNVYAVFAEVAAPILRNLELSAAVRYDDYEGVGSSTNPKVGVRFQPIQQVLLRASAGKGFRAPSLLDLFAPRTTGVTIPGLNDPIRCPITGSALDCVTQFPITNGGNSALVPEESRNVNVGIVLEPVNNVSLSVDYFNIKVEEFITTNIPAPVILSDLTRYGSLVTRGAPTTFGGATIPGPIIDIDQTNINLGSAYIAGIDVDLRAATPMTVYGRLGFSLNGTYFSKYDVENPDGSFANQLDTASAVGGVTPRWRHYAAVTWTYGPVALTFAQQYQKSYYDLPGTFEFVSPDPVPLRKVGAYEIYNLQGVYTGIRNLTVTLGARNLFDKDPPYTNAGGQTSFQAGYDPLYADPRGRFLYARLGYKFF
ncbi:MAG TPA: TonB-dependent receptor [Burkholderiaceae bacterium]|jgi:iron complex outermembrane receptor protein|nr:TonB-dependent receptor [Burkholderiaceae bacterium]